MARQARAEATRQKIVNAALDLIAEHGYAATGLNDIIAAAGITKGAFYHHFDSKASLGSAIVEQALSTIRDEYDRISQTPSPPLESLIHGMFAVGDLITNDRFARSLGHVVHSTGQFSVVATDAYRSWSERLVAQLKAAIAEGDVRAHVDPEAAADLILMVLMGAELVSNAIGDEVGIRTRLAGVWDLVLFSIVSDGSREFFREFIERGMVRRAAFG